MTFQHQIGYNHFILNDMKWGVIMVRQREFDVDKALDAAMQLFWEKGYEATSLSDLTSAMGIQRPSIYSTFGDKKELFEAALRRYTSAHAVEYPREAAASSVGEGSVPRFFEGLVEEEYAGTGNRGCFCINTMVELAPHDAKFEILTREHEMYLAAIFQETIEKGLRSGELQAGLDAKALAQTLVVSLIGLTVIMKARPERAFVEHSVETMLSLIK